MSRFVFDSMVVFLLLLVTIALVSSSDESNKNTQMNSIIENFEDNVEAGNVVNDGYGFEDQVVTYDGNGISYITSKCGSIIVSGAEFGVSIIEKIISLFLG